MTSVRSMVTWLAVAFVVPGPLLTLAAEEAKKPDKHLLASKRVAGGVDRVDTLLEVGGTLKIASDSPNPPSKPASVPMNASAKLSYTEKTVKAPPSIDRPAASFRYYDKAEATIQVGSDRFSPTLRQQRRLIGVATRGGKITMYCPDGPLTREELDLVDLPGNSLMVDRLLPTHSVALGDAWKHSSNVLAALCGLDRVTQSDVQSVLQSIDEHSAQIEMAGYAAGSIQGLSSTIQLKAKYRFDMEAGRITWLALLIKEEREAGAVGPGLDVVARLQMKITPGVQSPQLAAAAAPNRSEEPSELLTRLAYTSPDAAWEMTYDRRWILISERKELTIFRMADEGDYVAQCNISFTPAAAGPSVTLAQFQDDIREALGKSFGQFVRASESITEAGYTMYRVEVQGQASGVPMEWIYYRLVDKPPRQMVALFTVEPNMAEKFRDADRQLVRAIRFLAPQVAAKPTTESPKTEMPK